MIEVQAHNTDLKKRLTAFAKEHPPMLPPD